MKLILLAIAVTIFATSVVSAQGENQKNDALEQKIRKLDLAEADAVLHSDTATLEKLWGEDFTVNNPSNQVTIGKKGTVEAVRAGFIKYSSLVREAEAVAIHGKTVIVMGLETAKPIGNAPFAGQTLRRRYTNIWMKIKGKWLLVARQSTIICQN